MLSETLSAAPRTSAEAESAAGRCRGGGVARGPSALSIHWEEEENWGAGHPTGSRVAHKHDTWLASHPWGLPPPLRCRHESETRWTALAPQPPHEDKLEMLVLWLHTGVGLILKKPQGFIYIVICNITNTTHMNFTFYKLKPQVFFIGTCIYTQGLAECGW